MNKSQQKAFKTRIKETVENVAEKESDQVEWRIQSEVKDAAGIWFQIETRVVNPDDDHDSGWSWSDGFGVGPRGKIHG